MKSAEAAADSPGPSPQERIHGALVGVRVGLAASAAHRGAARTTTPAPASSWSVSDLDPDFASLLSGTDTAGASHWVAVAIRAGLTERCDPMTEFVGGLSLDGVGRLRASAVAAVAAAVSATVDGSPWADVLSLAVMAADEGGARGTSVPGPDVAARMAWATALAAKAGPDALDVVDLLVGTTDVEQECVPAAFAVLAARNGIGEGAELVRAAAGLGGACEVTATVVGAVLGAEGGVAVFGDVGRQVLDGVDDSELAATWAEGRS